MELACLLPGYKLYVSSSVVGMTSSFVSISFARQVLCWRKLFARFSSRGQLYMTIKIYILGKCTLAQSFT